MTVDGTDTTNAWDASAVHHAIRADRDDGLLDLADHGRRGKLRHVTTSAVISELLRYGLSQPERLDVEEVGPSLEELIALSRWTAILSAAKHNRGEATVCAWAEVHGAVVVMDDGDATRVARKAGLRVQGTLSIVAEAVQEGYVPSTTASNFVDSLLQAEARFPFEPGGFLKWARLHRLLGPELIDLTTSKADTQGEATKR